MTYTWREELAWAGGFWDGEGSTSLSKRDSAATAQISQVDNEVESLHRFQNAVLGLGKIGGPYDSNKKNGRQFFKWRADGGAKVQAVIAMLWPFLGNIKKEQAARVLKGAKWRGEGMCGSSKHLIKNPDWEYFGYKCEECFLDQRKRKNIRRCIERMAVA